MSTMTPAQYDKLPQYAKDEIVKLRDTVHTLSTHLQQVHQQVGTPVKWASHKQEYGIPARARIEFQTPEGEIEVSLRDGRLDIHSDGTLVIEPWAANACYISSKKI